MKELEATNQSLSTSLAQATEKLNVYKANFPKHEENKQEEKKRQKEEEKRKKEKGASP